MDFYASNLLLQIKRIVYSSIRLGYQCACDYPVVPSAGILLLFLHQLCPSLFMFLLSSSPVFLLTALLLGALLTYGEPCAPAVGEETLLGSQQTLSSKSKTYATDCSTEEIENVAVVAYAEKSFQSQVVCTEERTIDSIVRDTYHGEEKARSVSTDKVLSAEEFSEFANSNVIVEFVSTEIENLAAVACYPEKTFDSTVRDKHRDEEKVMSVSTDMHFTEEFSEFTSSNVIVETEGQQQKRQQSLSVPSNVVVEAEERTMEINENVNLQEFESANTESYYNSVHNGYQLGELMSSCWQPVIRQDPCSDSESDISGSSSDASMTDIIPMLDELNPSVNMGSGHPSSAFRDSLNSSSDEEDDSEEDGDHGSDEGAEEKDNDENKSEDNLDPEEVTNVDSLMERRRAKNILKFELDKRLMDMEAADTIQKMEEASRFRVQVPSISTPRPKPFDPSNGSEETIELPQIPDSAPSVLLPWRKPFDIPFDQIVDRERKLQETWTPRSYFPSTQHRKHGNLYLRESTYLENHSGVMAEKTELSKNDACDSWSDSGSEETENNGKLFGSLEAHIGEEIKLVSAAISDACVLEANCKVDEGNKNINLSDDTDSFCIQKSVTRASEAKDSVPAGSEPSTLHSLSNGNNSEQHIFEAVSISEVNLLFKNRVEEVQVQSTSESAIGQPLTVKLEDDFSSSTLSADSGMPAVEASSVEELNSRISQLTQETLAFGASNQICDNQLVQDRSSGTLPSENGHLSLLPIEDGRNLDSTLDEAMAIEESSVEEMNSSFEKIEEEAQEQIYPRSVHMFDQNEGETSDMLVVEAKSIEDITSAFGCVGNGHGIELSQNGEVILDQENINSGLRVTEGTTTNYDDKI